MAKCEQGYLCEVCGEEVEEITESDLYLRFVIGEIDSRELLSARERHIACNPVLGQFIVDDGFVPIRMTGPFDKANFPADETAVRESLVTRGWKRLQTLAGSGLRISDYPLSAAARNGAGAD